jgi:hypothetical protein
MAVPLQPNAKKEPEAVQSAEVHPTAKAELRVPSFFSFTHCVLLQRQNRGWFHPLPLAKSCATHSETDRQEDRHCRLISPDINIECAWTRSREAVTAAVKSSFSPK